jgi:dihydroflavonol-4-reductase
MTHEPQTVFVTGATGLLGNHIVRELLSRGDRVRALCRERSRAESLLPDDERLELVEGDLEDVERFEASLDGATLVIHSGAYFRDSFKGGSHHKTLEAVNVHGTRALVAAAYRRGIRRFLHVSTVGTLEPRGPGGGVVDDTMRRTPESTANDYYRSKILADREIEQAMARHPDLWAAFVLPGFMNGPGDAGPTSAGQTIMDFAAGRIPGVLDAHFSFVDARDVAIACVEACERADRGERFIVAGRRMSLADEMKILERITGVAAPKRRMPLALLGLFAWLQEGWAAISGRPVLIGLTTYRLIRDEGPYARYDSSKAEAKLGVRFRPIEETLADAVEWLRARGMLDRAPARLAPA